MDRIKSNFLLPLLSAFMTIVVWKLVVMFGGWSEQVFPDPMKVARSLIELTLNGTLLKNSIASLYRVTAGFYLAVLLGVPLGIILGRVKLLRDIFTPLINFLRPISPLAWIPLAMLWFGIGYKPAIFLIFLASFFPLLIATTIAVLSINPIFFQVAANFNLSNLETVTKIIVPAIIPDVVTALRLTIAIAWLVVVAAEMIAVQSGLGYLILDSRNALRMDYVMVGMIMIGLLGVLLDSIMRQLALLASYKH